MSERMYLTFAKEVIECRRFGCGDYDSLHKLFIVMVNNDLLNCYQNQFLSECFYCDVDDLITNSKFHIVL